MNKKIIVIVISILVILGVAGFFITKKNKPNPNQEAPARVETPPQVEEVNSMPLASRPYVELIRHSNPARCSGVDMIIENLKNGEKKADYELEYTTDKLIQAVFGTRDFTIEQKEAYKPLEFGTCSHGKCKCDKGVNGGSLKLSLYGNKDYVLKGDFVIHTVDADTTEMASKDVRLSIKPQGSLKNGSEVLIMSTLGLPQEINSKVILGPYGIFVEGNPELTQPMNAFFQAKDGEGKKVQFWDGDKWQVLDSQFADGKVSFKLERLGVVVLTD